MILADTSVWVDHFRRGNARLASLLRDEQVLVHPLVIGELACGNLKNRTEVLSLLMAMPEAGQASHQEVLRLVETHRLYGRGLGWIDMHMLASALLSRSALWTLDAALGRAASALKISV
jgi:predicted nucleic acid-binding protein